MDSKSNISKALFDKFIGALIFINILHQVISSMDLPEYHSVFVYGEIFFQISMIIFLGELLYRLYIERRLGFLNAMDSLVLVNYFFIGVLDLRIFSYLDFLIFLVNEDITRNVLYSKLFICKDTVF